MNNLRTNIHGIDVRLQEIQEELYEALVGAWGDNITGYGRVYKNVTEKGNIPEWYDATKGDYFDTYFHDSDTANFCFLVDDTSETEDELVFTNNVKCVFVVNLEKAYGNDVRNDQEAKRDALQALRDADLNMFKINEVQTGIKNVFNDYYTEKIKYLDMQPYYCFSINFEINYYLTDKC